MKTRTFLTLIIIALIYCLYPAGTAASAGNQTGPGGSLTVFSSPDLYPLAMNWAGAYEKLHPGKQIQVTKAEGDALAGLVRTGGQIGFISGREASSLVREPVWEVVVGRDVIVPVINSANPFMEEINRNGISPKAFAASLREPGKQDWGTLLKNNHTQPVHYYIVKDPSTEKGLSDFLMLDVLKSPGVKTVTREEFAAVVREDPFAVGFCRLTDILDASGQNLAADIRLLPVDRNGNGKLDYMEQIYGDVQTFSRGVWIGKYPKALTCDLFSVSSVSPSGEAGTGFLSWVLTDGQQFLTPNGYCALVPNERQSQLDKVNPPEMAAISRPKTVSYQIYVLLGLALLFLLGFLLDRILRMARKDNTAPAGGSSTVPAGFDEHSLDVPKGLWFDKTHTWAFVEQDGAIRTGVDDFLGHVTGPMTRVELKNPGEKIAKGDPFITLIQQGKKLVINSPVSGTIRAQNRALAGAPALLKSSPYSEGWAYRIEPANWSREMRLLAMAEKYRSFLAHEITRLKDFLASSLQANHSEYAQVVLQDGGTFKEGFLAEMSPEVWEDFQEKFLNSAK